MPASPYPVFVINLPRSHERREYIDTQMRQFGINYELVEAVDGYQLTKSEMLKRYGKQLFNVNPYNKQVMTPGAVGCLLSHLKLYDLIIEQDIEIACILEDDAKILSGFTQILQSPALHNSTWEVLLLGHYSMRHQSLVRGAETGFWTKKVCSGHYIAKPAEFPFLTLGYMIKKSAVEKLRRFAYPLRMPADWVTANAELAGAHLRLITPPCLLCEDKYRKNSLVGSKHDAAAKAPSKQKYPSLILQFKRLGGKINYVIQRILVKANITPKAYTRRINP